MATYDVPLTFGTAPGTAKITSSPSRCRNRAMWPSLAETLCHHREGPLGRHAQATGDLEIDRKHPRRLLGRRLHSAASGSNVHCLVSRLDQPLGGIYIQISLHSALHASQAANLTTNGETRTERADPGLTTAPTSAILPDMQFVVVDYGAGNLRSVAKAFAHVGLTPTVTSDPAVVLAADAVVLPGVGAAGDAMRSLGRLGLDEAVRAFVTSGRPFLGVCLGMQVLLSVSDEDGEQPCLDVVPGRVRLLPPGLKVPHMGWNQVRLRREHPVFTGIPADTNFYFVHSYYCDPSDPDLVLGETDYGLSFCSALARDNAVRT